MGLAGADSVFAVPCAFAPSDSATVGLDMLGETAFAGAAAAEGAGFAGLVVAGAEAVAGDFGCCVELVTGQIAVT